MPAGNGMLVYKPELMFRKDLIDMLLGNQMTVTEIARVVDEPPSRIVDDLQLWVDAVRALGVTLSGTIPCTDAGRWPVQREFNRRLQKRFQALDISLGLKLGEI